MFGEPARLPTHVWLMAQLRQTEAAGGTYYILQRGEAQSGTVIAKIMVPGRIFYLYQQNRDENGALGWMALCPRGTETRAVEENWADAYIARAKDRDPDLWVVEIETRTDEFPLEGPVFNDAD